MSNVNCTTNKRIYYIDVLRVLACLLVILIHASAMYVLNNFGSFNYWIGNIINSFSRVSVPIFVMISGALILDNNYNFTVKKIIKHIRKLIIFFAFWSLLYCILFRIIIPIFINCENINIVIIIGDLIKGHYHLWFIYMIIGLYLISPLLRLWVTKDNKKYVEYFIILSLIFNFLIPQIITIGSIYSDLFSHLNDLVEYLNIKYVCGYTTYFVLGWYINNFEIKNKKGIYYLGIICLMLTMIVSFMLSSYSGKPIYIYGYLTTNIFFQTLATYIFIKYKFKNKKYDKKNFLISISNNSMGIYAIHAAFVYIINKLLDNWNIYNALMRIPIVFIMTFIISYVLTCLLKKIPKIKQIL